MNHNTIKITALIMILAFGLSPALSYAKNDDNKKGRDDNHKQERIEKNDKSCLKSFGHLFAPGFIKNWGRRSFDADCSLPFGIDKKFRGLSSSTSPILDITAPIISDLSVKSNIAQATVNWHTNERSNSAVFWGTSPNVTSSSTLSVSQSNKTRNHKVIIEGLSASTTYYLIVRSQDVAGNTSTSTEISFTTKSLAIDNAPPIISNVSLLVGTSTINISWKTDENTTSKVYYGTSLNLDINSTSTLSVENASLVKSHLIPVINLSMGTQYYLVIESRDATGNRTTTPVFSTILGI